MYMCQKYNNLHRFAFTKTEDSKSDSDFSIDLPKTVNIPDDTIASISDIALPLSWTTINERTNNLYYSISHCMNGGHDTSYWALPSDFKNYNGSTLAEELMINMNDGLYDEMTEKL